MSRVLGGWLWAVAVAGLMLAFCVGAPRVWAAADQEPGSIDWNEVGDFFYLYYYVDNSSNMREYAVIKVVRANSSYIGSHCMTHDGVGIPHYHFEYELGSGGLPSAAEVEAWYDYMLGAYMTGGPQGGGGASDATNCYNYGANHTSGGGTYTYFVSDPSIMIGHDYVSVESTDLDVNDLGVYWEPTGTVKHVSQVTGVAGSGSGRYIAGVSFKWGVGGVYTQTFSSWLSGGRLTLYQCWTEGQTLDWNMSMHEGSGAVNYNPGYYTHR